MICVIGLGFVGLTTALGFAHYGFPVVGYDIDKNKTNVLKQKKLPFLEPNLDKVLEEEYGKHFSIAEDISEALKNCEVVFFCTGTPCKEDGEVDLQILLAAVEMCVKECTAEKNYVFVIKSTVPPSTTEGCIIPLVQKLSDEAGLHIDVVNNPEFLREGYCWNDFIHADRIVIGTLDGTMSIVLEELYRPFGAPIYAVSYSTAEFIKYLSNTLLATMISFSNEMASIADDIGMIDVEKAFKILHMDKRWNNSEMRHYVYPGCGYGGYCLPKDTKALCAMAESRGIDAHILKNVIEVNENRANAIVLDIMKKADRSKTIGILGLAFKPNSDDVRDSPAARIVRELLDYGYYKIIAYDPAAILNFQEMYRFDIDYEINLMRVQERADVLVIVTAWKEFLEVKHAGRKPVLDYRYM